MDYTVFPMFAPYQNKKYRKYFYFLFIMYLSLKMEQTKLVFVIFNQITQSKLYVLLNYCV